MGRIKSALEIAMERTEDVKGDKTSIGLFDAKQRGKRLANQFLEGETASLEAEFAGAGSDEERHALKQGCFEVFITQINLPAMPEDVKRLEAVGKGLAQIVENKRFAAQYKEFLDAAALFLKEAAKYDEAIRRQYAPKLRQKEEELGRRIGRKVKIDPFQDPEFVNFYNQNMNALRGQYQAIAEETQTQARDLFT